VLGCLPAAFLPIACASAGVLSHLQVEQRDLPLGIDAQTARFSWRTEAASDVRGVAQTAYQIVVRDAAARTVWNSGRVADSHSLDIPYAGTPLRAESRYDWTLTAWDNHGITSSAQSSFETGLMNPDPTLPAWEGATWIGGTDADRVLYSQYLPIFDLEYSLTIASGSSRASVVFAANDPRLMDRNKNIYQLQNAPNASYFRVELDVGSTRGDPARLNVYRAGYSKTDDPTRPISSFKIKGEVINEKNRYAVHRLAIRSEYGELTLRVDGNDTFFVSEEVGANSGPPAAGRRKAGSTVSLNPARDPAGAAHDFLTYGLLCDIGFQVDAGQSASFSNFTIANTRNPANAVFHEDLTQLPYRGLYRRFAEDAHSGLRIEHGAYVLTGGKRAAFVVADPSHGSMPMLRTTFDVGTKKIKAARLYATARGIYELYLNGKRVGDGYYNPGLTQYNRTHLYQTYDVTNEVAAGRNALGALLGEGWWSGLLSFGNIWNHFGDRQSLLAKLVVIYDDGSREVLTTNDRMWKYFNDGPIVYSSLSMGEVYDAMREASVEGWSTASYDDRAWHSATKVPLQGTAFMGPSMDASGAAGINYDHLSIVGQIGEPAKIYQVLTARSVKEVRKGVYVYDMAQNLVGVPRIRFEQGEPGRRVIIRVSEMLYPDQEASGANVGMIMTENYRAALSQDQYVMKAGAQTFQPRFTSHGFQYLEITGLDAPLPLSRVQAVAISSLQRVTASYESSNPKVNRLWSNLVWSNVDNFLTIPTDCPQRNERMGWSGDLSVFSRTATYLSEAGPFLERHMRAMRDVQLPSGKFTDIAPVGGGFGGLLWGSAGITVAWEAYQQYADTALLREHYAAMVAYSDYLNSTIDPATGLNRDVQLGDWLGPQNEKLGAAFLATAYHVYDLGIMVRVAQILGRQEDAAKYRRMLLERKAFFNRTFVNGDRKTLGLVGPSVFPGGPLIGKGEYQVADTQTSYAVGLALGAFSDENIPYMEKNLAAAVERENVDDRGSRRPKYSLMTGFIGTAWITKALSDMGRTDLAYRLLQNNQYPSWLYAVDQGATTIWERLNGYTVENGFGGNNSMNSFNHYSFGAVGQWLMAHSLGIERGEPGFKSFVLRPEPDPTGQMTWAKGHYESEYGTIESAWSLERGVLTYTATVPANTSATLFLPARSSQNVQEAGTPAANADGITFSRYENGKALYQLTSGTYRFTSPQ
jgi:alpha-L-rhamnosidase